MRKLLVVVGSDRGVTKHRREVEREWRDEHGLAFTGDRNAVASDCHGHGTGECRELVDGFPRDARTGDDPRSRRHRLVERVDAV